MNLQLSNREHALRANSAPSKRGGREHRCAWTDKVRGLVLRAQIGNVLKHPHLNCDRYEARNYGCDDLCREHRARRDLHVVAKFEVTEERRRLAD